jgi:hypothetical protein
MQPEVDWFSTAPQGLEACLDEPCLRVASNQVGRDEVFTKRSVI